MGVTSHDVGARPCRRSLGGVKTGHAGTLDPFAGGLLDRAGGQGHEDAASSWSCPSATRRSRVSGARSSTGDPEGEITETRASCRPTRRAAHGRDPPAPADLLGDQDQRRAGLPQGAAWGELSDAGADRDRRAASSRPGVSSVRGAAGYLIECSSGTYVRSLIADLGDAYCEELRRTAIGPFEVADAVGLPPRGQSWSEPPLSSMSRPRCRSSASSEAPSVDVRAGVEAARAVGFRREDHSAARCRARAAARGGGHVRRRPPRPSRGDRAARTAC